MFILPVFVKAVVFDGYYLVDVFVTESLFKSIRVRYVCECVSAEPGLYLIRQVHVDQTSLLPLQGLVLMNMNSLNTPERD